MGLIDLFKEWISSDRERFLYSRIPPEQTDRDEEALVAESGKHYFRVWLAEMFLKEDRKWFRTRHPVVHSTLSLQLGAGNPVEIPHVAGQFQLKGLAPTRLDQVVQLNHPLTALIPFGGGVVELTSGLVSMRGEDMMARFVKTLGDFSSLLSVPQLSSALALAGPLASGLQDLFGAEDRKLCLGLHDAFTGKGGGGTELRPGYLALLDATENGIRREELWVKEDRLCRGPDLASSRPLTGVTFMLFQLEVRPDRDDWKSLDDIQRPLGQALDMLARREKKSADTFLRNAVLAAWQSPDLTELHRRVVVKSLQEEYAEFASTVGLGAVPGDARPDLERVMARAPSFAEAVNTIDLETPLESWIDSEEGGADGL